jgi:hypothetical protein
MKPSSGSAKSDWIERPGRMRIGDAVPLLSPHRRVVHHSDRNAAYSSLACSQRVTELEFD